MPMFGFICKKKSRFSRQSINCQFNFTSFCMQGQPGLEIKIRDHFQTHFDSTNSMASLDLANEPPLKITFLEVSLIVSIYVNYL